MLFLGELLEEEIAIVDGYNAYFSFSKVRSGYSGSALIVQHSSIIIISFLCIYLILSISYSYFVIGGCPP